MAALTSPSLVRTDTQRRNSSLGDPGVAAPDCRAGKPPGPGAMAKIALQLAAQVDVWRPLLHVDPDRRWYARLDAGEGWEAWLLTWLPGQQTDLHDHGGSSGAFTVLEGQLQELTPAPSGGDPTRLASRVLRAPQVRSFGPSHIHQVLGTGDTAAASLHVYTPALRVMNRYELDPERGPIIVQTDRAGEDW
jgi:hypothetical protein